MDNDGDIDVLSASRGDNKIAWYENDGSQNFISHVISLYVDGASSIYAEDINGDGYMDVISGSYLSMDAKISWYENDGTESFTEKTIDADLDGAGRLVVRDLDEDGDMDVIVTALDANDVVWYANNGSESFTKSIIDDDLENARHVVVRDRHRHVHTRRKRCA